MFRPNRIGTPIIHTPDAVDSTLNFSLQQKPNFSGTVGVNVINSATVQDFGRSSLVWTGTEAVNAGHKIALAQQVSVTAPLTGDVAGIELNGTINIDVPTSALVVGFAAKLPVAQGSLLAGVDIADHATYFKPLYTPNPQKADVDTKKWHSWTYQEQLIIDQAQLGLVLCHGFLIYDNSGAGWSLTAFEACMSVRQLNDQQNKGYRDTLR